MVHPKYSRFVGQILVFAFIWLIFGVLYVVIEVGLLGNSTTYPTTGNPYDFETNFVFISLGCFIMGIAQGWLEVVWLKKRFEQKPF